MINNVYSMIKASLDEGCYKNVYSGCGLGIFSCEDAGCSQLFYAGRSGREIDSHNVDMMTYFDVASLTKPLVTLLALAVLLSQGKIALCDSVVGSLEIGKRYDRKDIRIIDLLGHRSGLPAHKPYFKELLHVPREARKHVLLDAILTEERPQQRGSYLYSDLDYILLGFVVEKLSGMDLYDFWEKMVIHPVGMKDYFFRFDENTGTSLCCRAGAFVETGQCSWSQKRLLGIVHDDNCRAFGKTMGHAGLFATLTGVVDLCRMILQIIEGTVHHPFIHTECMRLLAGHMYDDEHWALGFDVPTGSTPSCGRFFRRDGTIGHLGFTGTSFWLDTTRKTGIVFLTNRVLVDKDGSGIRRFRPYIHNRAWQAMQNI